MFILGVYLLVDASLSLQAYQTFGVARCRNFQIEFQKTGQRSTEEPGSSVTFSATLMRKGCHIHSLEAANVSDRPPGSLSFTVPEPIEIDGFSAIVSNSTNLACDGFFILSCRDDPGGRVDVIGTSSYRKVVGGIKFFSKPHPIFCGEQTVFDFQAPWPLFADGSLSSLTLSLGCISTSMLAALRSPTLGKSAITLFSLLQGSMKLVACIGSITLGLKAESLSPMIACAIHYSLAAVLCFKEGIFISSLLTGGGLRLVFRIIDDCAIFDDCAAMARRPPIFSAVSIVIALYTIVQRNRVLATSLSSVADDQALRDAEWLLLQQDRHAATDLADLNKIVDQICTAIGPEPPRQYNRRCMESSTTQGQSDCSSQKSGLDGPLVIPTQTSSFAQQHDLTNFGWQPGRFDNMGSSEVMLSASVPILLGGQAICDTSSPVTSLDQLYSQATAVASELDTICHAWALACDGEVVGGQGGPATCAREGGIEGLVRAGLLKRPERAAAKALTCYAGDPSRLLDVCRRRIAFGRVTDITVCLARMATDSVARIVRVKNLFREDANWQGSAGFRVRMSRFAFEHVLEVRSGPW
jgi:hypothetical protein